MCKDRLTAITSSLPPQKFYILHNHVIRLWVSLNAGLVCSFTSSGMLAINCSPVSNDGVTFNLTQLPGSSLLVDLLRIMCTSDPFTRVDSLLVDIKVDYVSPGFTIYLFSLFSPASTIVAIILSLTPIHHLTS